MIITRKCSIIKHKFIDILRSRNLAHLADRVDKVANRDYYKIISMGIWKHRRVGITRAYYAQIELMLRNPSIRTAKKLGVALKVDWTRFYDENDDDL